MPASSRNRLDGPERGLGRERTVGPVVPTLGPLEFARQPEKVQPDVLVLLLQ